MRVFKTTAAELESVPFTVYFESGHLTMRFERWKVVFERKRTRIYTPEVAYIRYCNSYKYPSYSFYINLNGRATQFKESDGVIEYIDWYSKSRGSIPIPISPVKSARN